MACCWSGISLANKSIAESKFEACRRTLLQIIGATGPINSFSISFNTVRIRWGSISVVYSFPVPILWKKKRYW